MAIGNPDAMNVAYFVNRSARIQFTRSLFTEEECARVVDFFHTFKSYAPTPLKHLNSLARQIGVRDISIKDESSRFGLPAFKVLGVSYAIHNLALRGDLKRNSVLVCATDGNHGRAVAHVAKIFGLEARIFLHAGSAAARIQAIVDEGADVVIVNGNYDDSVREAAQQAEVHNWTLVSDTAWPGYETVPRDIMAGYTMLLEEVCQQWAEAPDTVIVQAGVGGLACAVVSWFSMRYGRARPFIVCAEPETAACVLQSVQAGEPRTVKGSLQTIMAGLSCGTVSSLAWPVLQSGLDVCIAVPDRDCVDAVRRLAQPSGNDHAICSGESGACGFAALSLIASSQLFQPVREYLHLGQQTRVLLINTEGVTDPIAYRSYGLGPFDAPACSTEPASN
jgi:diaminopropionate ammonia-lyase